MDGWQAHDTYGGAVAPRQRVGLPPCFQVGLWVPGVLKTAQAGHSASIQILQIPFINPQESDGSRGGSQDRPKSSQDAPKMAPKKVNPKVAPKMPEVRCVCVCFAFAVC